MHSIWDQHPSPLAGSQECRGWSCLLEERYDTKAWNGNSKKLLKVCGHDHQIQTCMDQQSTTIIYSRQVNGFLYLQSSPCRYGAIDNAPNTERG